MILNEKQLNDMCSELMEMMWDEELEIPVTINGRLSSVFGRFISYNLSYSTHKPKCIEISKRLLSGKYKLATVEAVIKHELCHYYLCKMGEDFRDGDKRFEDEIKRIGSHSTMTVKCVDRQHECLCKTCNRVVARYVTEGKAKSTAKKYISTCCKGELKYRFNDTLVDNSKEVETEYTVINKYVNQTSTKASRKTANVNKEVICAAMKSDNKNDSNIKESTLKIEDIVIIKRKKVSQQNVWDAMLLAVEEKSPEKLRLIKQHYPELFNKICLFIGKKRVEYINSVV